MTEERRLGAAGLSGLTGSPARPPPAGISWKPPEYKEHDFRMAPKFLTPLLDRVVVAGYTAALNCAVRGHPKVRACGGGRGGGGRSWRGIVSKMKPLPDLSVLSSWNLLPFNRLVKPTCHQFL